MVYSPAKKSLFCFCCRLFALDEKDSNLSKFITGFNSWWKLNPKVADHEGSGFHLTNLEKWKTLAAGLLQNKTVDFAEQVVMEGERKKWRDILYRLLDVTLFLAKQNLPFRGHNEQIESENRGNFLELVNLLSNYDPVLKEHNIRLQQSLKEGKISVSYLSPKVQNEFISILGNSIKAEIVAEVKKANYFGILLDSTPDISHTEQLSEVIRYVHIENRKVEIKESFLGFIPLYGKKASDIVETIIQALEKDGLDLTLCRSQGYDNAANMSGIHSGVQAKIREINTKALFVPCANHSLNLCGVHAFATVPLCITFFGTMESIYRVFSTSTHRWDVLLETVGLTVKRLSDTRWSSHFDAVKPVFQRFENFVEALEKLCDRSENLDTRGAAEVLITNICNFNFLCFLHLWYHVLSEVNQVQKYLQIEGITLEKSITKLKSLKTFFKEARIELASNALQFATSTCVELNIDIESRGRKRFKKIMPGEESKDAGLTPQQEVQRAMLECIDKLYVELEDRTTSMERVYEKFAVIQSMHLLESSDNQLLLLSKQLTETFDDVQQEEIVPEIKRLRRHLQASGILKEDATSWSSLKMLQFIVEMDFNESVPNVCVALRLFLTACVSVSSCERSFSKLKLIKNYLRSTMSQSRLSSLAMISIENSVAKNINFDDIIKQFAEAKARKKRF
ncbi:zinc finger MYM-type protein 1-like [Uloborus diversus]|uniref:zinc finger MYM-type protein 1-like n=1 Tax=Uloborus diversus TaxID=327109 RepID=UPI0024090CE8|nr:zinc finger MYM-type protein 1-like [Uloborus diversus]